MENYLIKFLASILIWLLYAGLFVLWFVDGKIKKEQVLHALFASGIAWVAANMLKEIFHTERPFVINGLPMITLTNNTIGSYSFPSAHTAISFAIAFTIWLHDKAVGSAFVVVAVLIGVGRIFGNVHYPIDIFGGAIVGIVMAYVVEKLHLFKITPGKP